MAKRRALGPSAWLLGGTGLVIGVVAAVLVSQGNPGNMGLCMACFIRDIASFFGGNVASLNMGGTAYIRPEIIGLLLGATVAAMATREFKARGGSGMFVRFVLGFIFMVSALVFLGCPVRAWLRLGGGDLNAGVGVLGLVAGVLIGVVFLKRGYNVGRAKKLAKPAAYVMPVIAVVLLALALMTFAGAKPDAFATVSQGALSEAGKAIPGGMRAPLFLSLFAGLGIGALAQRSRFCTVGGIRDSVLVKRYDLLIGVAGLVVGVAVMNLVLGQFNLGFEGQPAAHTDFLGNFVPMILVGLTAVMMGGCPLRQAVMASEGDLDAVGAILGMSAGAFFSHGASLASSGAGPAPGWVTAIVVMAVVIGGIFVVRSGLVARATKKAGSGLAAEGE